MALPDIHDYYTVMEAVNEELASTDKLTSDEKALVHSCGYGHMADGDIQLSIGASGPDSLALRDKVSAVVDDFLVSFVSAKNGSITGECGVGVMRVDQLQTAKNPGTYHVMRQIKQTLDPN